MDQVKATTRVVDDFKRPRLLRRKIRLEVLNGPNKGLKEIYGAEEINIGTLPSNDLVLNDSSVSRYHLRISTGAQGFIISDLDSTNGTFLGGIRLREVTISHTTDIKVGETVIRIIPLDEEVEVPLHISERFGSMIGRSPQIRAIFMQIPSIGGSDSTVLIEGETGTGKELLAEEIHKSSARRDHPFIVLDCSAIPENLVESELFGHVRGSFTGAVSDRAGAFELAHGGTLFLDEIGELSLSSQPKLLRVLESRQIKPVGSTRYRAVDVRIIAATNRDLRLGVNEGTFRPDLFYRLSVIRLHLPPLRDRIEDIELLANKFMVDFWQKLSPGAASPPLSAETVQRLIHHRWPGNIRELRNVLERVAIMARGGGIDAIPAELDTLPATNEPPQSSPQYYVDLPYKEAKLRWMDQFEVAYLQELLNRHKGNVAAAARQAGVDRTYIFRLMRKYGVQR